MQRYGSQAFNNLRQLCERQRCQEFPKFATADGLVELSPRDLCYIDEETAKVLELVKNSVDETNRKHSLFGYLNLNTSTTTGARLLRQSVLKPLSNFELIDHRLDCVEYFVKRVDTLATVTNCIKRFGQGVDLDSVITCLVNSHGSRFATLAIAERRLEALTTLETLIAQVPALAAALEVADQPALNHYKIQLQDPAYAEILDDITSVIETDVRTKRTKRSKMFRIKHGVEALFDIARNTYNAAINDLEQYVRELHKIDGVPWKLNHSETKGYHLTVATSQIPKNYVLGPQYIRVNKNRVLISCTTKDLMQSNVRANISYENSMKLANEILSNCLSAIIHKINAIYNLVDVIGVLDLLTSFAKLITDSKGSLVRPKFSSTDTILYKSRHPVLESVLHVNGLTAVPNDVMLSTNQQGFMLVTGPNMGGKSVFLKQIGIIQVMAQIGCYVPAESAVLKIMNRIVARSGTTEDNQSSCSSFMWEMRGIATALTRDESTFDDSVLYLIDEVGRGTSIDDGASYSFAIAEELAMRRYCFSIFATHFSQIFSLVDLYPCVSAHHFKYEEEVDRTSGESRLKISHNLVPGLVDNGHYGIKLAEASGLPEEILRLAKVNQGLRT